MEQIIDKIIVTQFDPFLFVLNNFWLLVGITISTGVIVVGILIFYYWKCSKKI